MTSPSDDQSLNPGRLLQLRAGKESWSADELASMFRHQLNSGLAQDLSGMSGRDHQAIESLIEKECPGVRTFADLFSAPSPPMQLLELTKRFAKAHRADPLAVLPPEISTGIYFLAIVAARLRYGKSITQLPEAELKAGADWVARQAWCDMSARRLLREFAPE